MRAPALLLFALALVPRLSGQATGAITGVIRDSVSGHGVAGALITIDDGRRGARTGDSGAYRIREIRSGTYRVMVRAIGYHPIERTGIVVRSGESTELNMVLLAQAVELDSLTIAGHDAVLDPLATRTEQRVTAADLRNLPVSSLEEALELQAGAVGTSYRGGRLGQESFVIDGLGLKNQLDAASNPLGLRFPPDLIADASLVTNGFSARYGQSLSGLINVVTREPGDRWAGRLAYETDRPMSGLADHGLDRITAGADGPLGRARVLFLADATARVDAEPTPGMILPNNRGEELTLAGKLTLPLDQRRTLRLLALRTAEQRLLFEPAVKYDSIPGLGRRTTGNLLSGHLQHASAPAAATPLILDLRLGYFTRDFVRGTPLDVPDPMFGAFSAERITIAGEEIARRQDTVTAAQPIPGIYLPRPSELTPWGVPAFFTNGSTRGEVSWNRFRELRAQLDANIGVGERTDLLLGASLLKQEARTFQRVLGFLAVGDSVPPAAVGRFSPQAISAYIETQGRLAELGITLGIRYDGYDARSDLRGLASQMKHQLNPRIAVATALAGATILFSGGSFSQPPDYQFLVDAAFEDTARTGRFRRGNPSLGFERSWQWELSVRARPTASTSVKVNLYNKRLDGLIGSAQLGSNPDSSIFGNRDAGTVRGIELLVAKDFSDGWGARLLYTLQGATAHSTSAFLLNQLQYYDSITGDTVRPARVEFPLDYDRRHALTLILQGALSPRFGPHLLGTRPLAGLEAAVVGRYASGLPYTRILTGKDSVFFAPNNERLPGSQTIDLLVRRPISLGGLEGSLYMDVRNLFNRRNVLDVRVDTGRPEMDEAAIVRMADSAYFSFLQHHQFIPYESAYYRPANDLNGDGYISGEAELRPLFLRAARDFVQPVFAYGTPRLVRLGMELVF